MRVIVCGGRDYADGPRFVREMHAHPVTAIAHGGAKGADTLANAYALMVGIPVTEYPAQWGEFGKGAGPIRNGRMLADFKPDAVIAFPGGRGTADMVAKAKLLGVRVIEVVP